MLCRLVAALVIAAVLTSGCSERPVAERRLVLRESDIPIRCDAKLVEFSEFRYPKRKWFGFEQKPLTKCTLELPVPPDSTLSYRVALSPRARALKRTAIAALRADVDGVRKQTEVVTLKPGALVAEGSVELPSGSVTISFVVASAPGKRTGSVVWGELVIETRSPRPATDDGLGWVEPPEPVLRPFLQARARKTRDHPRLLIVGADGASWKNMKPLLDQGKMPTLAALRERGRWGVLRAATVPESSMGWTAMRTGVRAGKSGNYSFIGGSSPRRSFWDLVGDRGFRFAVVGVPTSVPSSVSGDGILIGSWNPRYINDWAHPPELHELLERAGYSTKLINIPNRRYFLQEMEAHTDLALTMLRDGDWDLGFVAYVYTDTVAHHFGLESDEWNAIYRAFVDEDTLVMVVSDHGWNRYPVAFAVNTWLQTSGFGKWRAGIPGSGSTTTIARADQPMLAVPEDRASHEAELRRLEAALEGLEHGPSGLRVVKRTRRTEDAFPGRYSQRSPGRLLVEGDEHFKLRSSPFPSVFGPAQDDHSHDGVYLMAGPGIEPGEQAEASVLDVAPTVLAWFGIAPAPDSDGSSLIERADLVTVEGPLYLSPGSSSHFEKKRMDPDFEADLRTLGYVE
jgi:predicted AlkP superfamily phosphohydrolase/phosphomutase